MRIATTTFLLLVLLPTLTFAQGYSRDRAKTWDFSIGGIYQDGDSPDGTGGSSLDLKSDLGIAFNIRLNPSRQPSALSAVRP